jgi:hypothetical protein
VAFSAKTAMGRTSNGWPSRCIGWSMEARTDRRPDPREERRVHRRAPIDRPVLLDTGSRTTTARAVNVSAGGIALRTDLPLTPAAGADLYFELPIGYPVEVRAEVLRTTNGVVVLRFVDAPKEVIVALRAFCRISGAISAAP